MIPQNFGTVYRSEIDGLRGLAVIMVIAHHVGLSWLPGGFLGVDIFFVISGYLITANIQRDLSAQIFSLREFFIRRIRRILPALIVVLVISSLFAYYLFPPENLRRFSESLLFTTVFGSNYYFAYESGYFDIASNYKPLIHTWSLGVEEQFYLLFPLVMMWAHKTQRTLAVLMVILIVSLGLAEYGARMFPEWNFYSIHSRAWELMLGAVVAVLSHRGPPTYLIGKIRLLSTLYGFGIVAVVVPAFFITDNDLVPGLIAVIPVLGAALVLGLSGHSKAFTFGLNSRLLVLVGILSYSLYLWHQPVLVFGRYWFGNNLEAQHFAGLLALCFLGASATYVLVERPARNRVLWPDVKVVSLIAVLMMTLIAMSIWLRYADVAVKRDPGTPFGEIGHTEFHDRTELEFSQCQNVYALYGVEVWKSVVRCHQAGAGEPTIIFLGDSHAEQLFVGAAQLLAEPSIYLIRAGDPDIFAPSFKGIHHYMMSTKDVDTVVYSAMWNEKIKDMGWRTFAEHVIRTVEWLVDQDIHVVLVMDIPFYPFDPSQCLYYRDLDERQCDQDVSIHLDQQKEYQQLFTRLAEHPAIELINLSDLFCTDDSCSMTKDGTMLYRDFNHLNWEGALLAGSTLVTRSEYLRSVSKVGVR